MCVLLVLSESTLVSDASRQRYYQLAWHAPERGAGFSYS